MVTISVNREYQLSIAELQIATHLAAYNNTFIILQFFGVKIEGIASKGPLLRVSQAVVKVPRRLCSHLEPQHGKDLLLSSLRFSADFMLSWLQHKTERLLLSSCELEAALGF